MPNPTLITEWSLLRWLLNNASKALNAKAPWQYLVFWRYLYQGQPVSVNRTQTAAILKGSRVMHSVKRPPSTTRTKVHHLCNIIFCRVAGWEFLEHVHKLSDSSLSGCYSLARVYFWYAVKIYICALTFSDLSLTLWWGPGVLLYFKFSQVSRKHRAHSCSFWPCSRWAVTECIWGCFFRWKFKGK